jgi:hypothetical protein
MPAIFFQSMFGKRASLDRHLLGGFADDFHAAHEGAFEDFVAEERRLAGALRFTLQELSFAQDIA